MRYQVFHYIIHFFLLQQNDTGLIVVHARHGPSDGGCDVCRVTDDVLLTFQQDIVTIYFLGEVYGHSQVSRIVDEDGFQP